MYHFWYAIPFDLVVVSFIMSIWLFLFLARWGVLLAFKVSIDEFCMIWILETFCAIYRSGNRRVASFNLLGCIYFSDDKEIRKSIVTLEICCILIRIQIELLSWRVYFLLLPLLGRGYFKPYSIFLELFLIYTCIANGYIFFSLLGF